MIGPTEEPGSGYIGFRGCTVVGDAALLVDPASAASIAEGIGRVLSDAHLAAELVARGDARARHVTWERAAEETLRAFERAVELRRAGAA